jgi:hypothetical protein
VVVKKTHVLDSFQLNVSSSIHKDVVFEMLTNGKKKWFEIKEKLKVYPNLGQKINYGYYFTSFLMFLFGIKAN